MEKLVLEITTGFLSLTTAVLGFFFMYQKEKIKQIETQLSKEKYRVYGEVFQIFFDILKVQKKLVKEIPQNELLCRLLDVQKDLIIYASDTVLKKFFEWRDMVSNNSTQENNLKQIGVFMKLFTLIRKDMGNPKTIITDADILKAIMASNQDFNEIKGYLEN